MHEKTKRMLMGFAAIAAAGAAGAGIAGAAKSDDSDGRREGAAKGAKRGHHPFGPGRHHRGSQPHPPSRPCGHHGTPLTGEAAEKAKAAALEALPEAEILEAFEEESDEISGAKYEVHAIRKDGRPAEVILDADFKVLETLDRGPGGPPGHGGPPSHGTPLTGETAEKAETAAKAAVPGATVRGSLEVPEGRKADAAYVVFMARKNGRPVIVLLDANFKVVRKLTGPPRGRHGHGPPGPQKPRF